MKSKIILLAILVISVFSDAICDEPDTVWTKDFYPKKVFDAKFSPNGALIALGLDHFVQIRDKETGELLKQYNPFGVEVRAVAFSPDMKYLAAVSERNYAVLWDLETDEERIIEPTNPDDFGECHYIDFSPNFQHLAFSSSLKRQNNEGIHATSIFIYDLVEKSIINQIPTGSFSTELEYSPDGNYLVTNSDNFTYNNLMLYDATTYSFIGRVGTEQDWQNLSILDINFSPDSKFILTVGPTGYAHYWNIENRSLIKDIKLTGSKDFRTISFNSTGNYFVVGGSMFIDTQIWDINNEVKIYSYGLTNGSVNGCDVFLITDEIISSSLHKLILYNGHFNSSSSGNDAVSFENLYPNPSDNTVTIIFNNPTSSLTSITISDIAGTELDVILKGFLETGQKEIHYDTSLLPSGIYFISINSSSYTKTFKMIKE